MATRLTSRQVAPMLFGSGFCSLVYQVGWLRELRLVFGASTAASAAVLAIFIGGLGTGSLVLGRRADRARNPLMLYGNLELVIAASAAVSPLLLSAIRKVYIASGGTPALGMAGGTAIRLVLAALVLAIPTLAMGGTLSAATRAIESAGDARRRELAVLYGTNTIGAVAGAMVSTFFLLELFGTRRAILVAALVNVLVAMIARSTARKAGDLAPDEPESSATRDAAPPADARSAIDVRFVLVASGLVGFVFFLMEMTWYRMLGPILGGTVFTFGLILATALFGIGAGGLAYAMRPAARAATVVGLALTCLFEAVGLAIPWALGDRVAFAASVARGGAVFGFAGQVGAWAMICALVILPAAIASGVQFPLLVNLVGRGRANVGRHLGLVYASNTIGAIAGSLLGGFLLLPALGAINCWRLAVVLLVAVAAGAFAFAARGSSWRTRVPVGALAVLALVLLFADGPSAAWRHAGIGAGRSTELGNPAAAAGFARHARRLVKWETEGVESSVAITSENGIAFVVNGKIDGNALGDAATQMMGGLVGAAIHPDPKRALVIGLGTGETAGWLAHAPGIERVDVVELEPAIREVARRCGLLNHDVLDEPKVHLHIGDAREVLLVSDAQYDVVFSEPSNPYRAGVSSLYTREFYEAVRDRLGKDGLFLQWTQSYEVDGQTIATIYATLARVFSEVHTWRLGRGDLLFVASATPIHYDAARIADRVGSPAIRDALEYTWHVDGVEGFMSHFVGDTALTKEIAARAADINTDDRTLIEFAFARALGQRDLRNIEPLRAIAAELGIDHPAVTGPFDRGRFEEALALADALEQDRASVERAHFPADQRARVEARLAYVEQNPVAAVTAWKRQATPPTSHFDLLLVGEGMANLGDDAALPYIDAVRASHPIEADLEVAILRAHQRRWQEAGTALVGALAGMRRDPFVDRNLARHAIGLATDIAREARSLAPQILAGLAPSFAAYLVEETRLNVQLSVAANIGDAALADALAPIEPDVPWSFDFLTRRAAAYEALGHPRAARARADLEQFLEGQPLALVPATSGTTATPEP